MNRTGAFSVMLSALALSAVQPTFAAVPAGWRVAGATPAEYAFAVETGTAASGKQSASIAAKPDAVSPGYGTLMQAVAADRYRGARLKFSGYLRTQDAHRAQMWLRVDGPRGAVLAFDSMASRPVTGTTAWRRYEIVVDVPPQSVDVAFGFLLQGGGKVWGDGFTLVSDAAAHAVGASGSPLPREARNLDFEE